MKLPLFQIDAFTDSVFSGNPACVVPLQEWLEDDLLLKIAMENAVAETAYIVRNNDDKIHLRWFTPETEMDLCGHATLAASHALIELLGYKNEVIRYTTLSGDLEVRVNNGLYTLDFPSRKPLPAELPELLKNSLNFQPLKAYKARDFVLEYESEEQVKGIEINRRYFDKMELGTGGVIITAKGTNVDFVSRFFTPRATVFEDPVTGSAHCSLIPFWSERLNKKELIARQISERGGTLFCEDKGERVLISGKAKTYFSGHFWI